MSVKVSVVVPVYNVERYVERCVRSLMEQTLQDIEIIIVNDGSKDGSRDIVGRLAESDSRIRIIDNVNSGYGVSINLGFAAATGEYLGILESDDYAEPDAFEKLYAAAVKNDADVVKGCFNLYWTDPERFEYFDLFENLDEPMDSLERFDYSCANRAIWPLDYEHIFYVKASIWSAIYRADFIRENAILCHETPGASYQDASFNFHVLSKAKRLVLTHEVTVNYRQDNMTSSVNSSDKAFVIFGEYEEIDRIIDGIEALDERIDDAKELRKIAAYMKFDAYMWNYDRVNPKYHLELAERMSEEFRRERKRGALDVERFDERKWYLLDLLMRDPAGFVRLKDGKGVSKPELVRSKLFNGATIVRKEGLPSYAGRVTEKFLGKRPAQRFELPESTEGLVSIVMPAYNAMRYLEKTVQTVLDQTYPNFELIIVNDGSTDRTPFILERLVARDGRIRVINQENQGEGPARITGFEACRGEWLVSVDADDQIRPTMLEHMVARAEETNADVVICRVETLDDQTDEKLPCDWAFRIDEEIGNVFAPEEMSETLFNSFQNWMWNKMFRMSFLHENGIHFQSVRRTADLYFTCTALVSAQRIALLDEPLYLYRINNPTSAFATSDVSPLDYYEGFCALKEYLEEKGIYELYRNSFRNWAADGFRANLMVMRSLSGFETILSKYKEEGFARLEIDQIERKDWLDEEVRDFCRYMIEHDLEEDLFYALAFVKDANVDLETAASDMRMHYFNSLGMLKEISGRIVRRVGTTVTGKPRQ